jgi:amino acid transporter
MASTPEAAPALRRELGLRDITLFATTCIVGTRWIPLAAHAGPGSLSLWVLGAILFVVPLAIAVGALVVKYPGAGGLYLWTRKDYGSWHGFLAFWVYWLGIAFWFPSAAMFYMSAAFHTLGPSYARLSNDRFWLVGFSLAAMWVALGANLVGMRIGKWAENIGGMSSWVLGGLLIIVGALFYARRGSATVMHPAPTWNWETVNLWATIAYAMSGLELAGMMGAEIHDPERTLPRAGWIASGFTSVLYVASTASLLVLLQPEKISELNGFAEAAESAGGALHAAWLGPVIALLVLASAVGQFGGMGTAVSRLPFAAGADRLLPPAFARIHPRWGTPYVSILVFGGVASFLLITMQLGDTMSAAYQTLVSLMVFAGFMPFLYIFGSAWKAGKRLSAISGGAITALAIICSVAPSADIGNVWIFELKVATSTSGAILSAWLLYRRYSRA